MRRCRVVQPIFFRSFFSPTDASRSGSPPIDRPTNQEAGFVCVCVCVRLERPIPFAGYFFLLRRRPRCGWIVTAFRPSVLFFFLSFHYTALGRFRLGFDLSINFFGVRIQKLDVANFLFFLTRIDRIPPTFWTETGEGVPFALIVWCTEFVCLFVFYRVLRFRCAQLRPVGRWTFRPFRRPADRPTVFFFLCVCARVIFWFIDSVCPSGRRVGPVSR